MSSLKVVLPGPPFELAMVMIVMSAAFPRHAYCVNTYGVQRLASSAEDHPRRQAGREGWKIRGTKKIAVLLTAPQPGTGRPGRVLASNTPNHRGSDPQE